MAVIMTRCTWTFSSSLHTKPRKMRYSFVRLSHVTDVRKNSFWRSKEEDDPRWSNVFDDNTLSSSIQSVTGINCQFARCLYDVFGRIFFIELNFRIYLYSVYHVCCWTQSMKRTSYFHLTPVTVDTIWLWTIEISWPSKYLKKNIHELCEHVDLRAFALWRSRIGSVCKVSSNSFHSGAIPPAHYWVRCYYLDHDLSRGLGKGGLGLVRKDPVVHVEFSTRTPLIGRWAGKGSKAERGRQQTLRHSGRKLRFEKHDIFNLYLVLLWHASNIGYYSYVIWKTRLSTYRLNCWVIFSWVNRFQLCRS